MEDHTGSPTIGIGPTETLTARVSAAALLRLLFRHPETRQWMLALEHTATLRPDQDMIEVKAKPFGGGVRILDLRAVYRQLGAFNFDSLRSKEEADFRVYVRPDQAEKALTFCLNQFATDTGSVLESSPERELVEEIADTLGQQVSIRSFRISRIGAIGEPRPAASSSPRAPGQLTVRAYNLFQAEVLDLRLEKMLLKNSLDHSPGRLREMAEQDQARGGRGRANAVLALPWEDLTEEFRSRPAGQHGQDIMLGEYRLSGNVWNIIAGVSAGQGAG